MNMQFKQERREVKKFKTKISPEGYEHRLTLTKQYWNMCQDFLEMMEIKRNQNLQVLSHSKQLDAFLENIKSEVDFDAHCAIGLGKRMPIPPEFTQNSDIAHTLKQEIYTRVVQIWGENANGPYSSDPERLLKVA